MSPLWNDVVGNRRRCHHPTPFEAEPAERTFTQLMRPQSPPARRVVEMIKLAHALPDQCRDIERGLAQWGDADRHSERDHPIDAAGAALLAELTV